MTKNSTTWKPGNKPGDTAWKPGHRPWNTRDTPGCGKIPGHDTDYISSSGKKNCHECLKERNRIAVSKRARRDREAAYDHYGRTCACCGESTPTFLTLDHTNNDGNTHRAEIPGTGASALTRWLRVHNYPEGFQVLCFNCNVGRHINGGTCPHVSP